MEFSQNIASVSVRTEWSAGGAERREEGKLAWRLHVGGPDLPLTAWRTVGYPGADKVSNANILLRHCGLRDLT